MSAEVDNNSVLTDEDRAVLKNFLLQAKTNGEANPLVATDVDLDGDGIADAFGLDENNELVLVPGVKLDDTTFESTGEDG